VSVIFSLVFLEFLVRALFPMYDPSGQVKFTQLSDGTTIGPRGGVFRQTKNTGDFDVEIRFNEWGLRDEKPLTAAKEEALFVVGDSFAFGWGVNARDRFSDRLQAIINQPVFNIAIAGGDFDGYDSLLRYTEMNGTHVRNLIISVTMENDLRFYDHDVAPESTAAPEGIANAEFNLFALNAYLTSKSALYVLFTHAAHQTAWLQRVAVQVGLIRPNLEGIGDENVSTEALASSARRLLETAVGRNVIILIIPSRRLWVGETARRAQAARVHRAFIDGLTASGMTVVDMRARLEAGGNPLSYHFANDGHWNQAGHQLAAEVLSEVLQRNSGGIIDTSPPH
jgi:hypothetical protein